MLLCAAAAAAVAASPASADLSEAVIQHERCEYRRGGPPGPAGNSLLVVSLEGVFVHRVGREIRVSADVRCQGPQATVDNVDEIDIVGSAEGGGPVIDERNGRFGPGAGGDGIKFRVRGPKVTVHGTNGRDQIVVATVDGETEIDLAAGPRRTRFDVFMTAGPPELVTIEGGHGDDLLDARPDRRPTNEKHRLKLLGGAGDDEVYGSPGNDWRLEDGPGNDLVVGGTGNDVIRFAGGHDTLVGGPGDDEIAYSVYEGFHTVPDPGDRIFAGPGRDLVADANRHRDLLDCGPGFDQVVHEPHDRPEPNCERKWYSVGKG
jgi:Ca2+-binding RTX toxin-like protein